MQKREAGIERSDASAAPAGQFGEPGIPYLSVSLQVPVRHVQETHCVVPPLVLRMRGHRAQGAPAPLRATMLDGPSTSIAVRR